MNFLVLLEVLLGELLCTGLTLEFPRMVSLFMLFQVVLCVGLESAVGAEEQLLSD